MKGIESSSEATSAINNSELEALKQEILSEMRKEIDKMKQEILEGKIITCYLDGLRNLMRLVCKLWRLLK